MASNMRHNSPTIPLSARRKAAAIVPPTDEERVLFDRVRRGRGKMRGEDVVPEFLRRGQVLLTTRPDEAGVGIEGVPLASKVDFAGGIDGDVASADTFDDELLATGGVGEDHGGGGGKGYGDVFDEFGGGEEGVAVLEFSESVLIGLPELDLGDVRVWVLFKGAAHPGEC